MKTYHFLAAIVLLFLPSVVVADEASRPNFIVFLTDDQGWGDLGCYGHPVIQSPNLDKFASEGMRLTQCYAACSVCSPSRSAILTGRTPYRNGVWRWIPGGSMYHLRESEIAIASLLKKRAMKPAMPANGISTASSIPTNSLSRTITVMTTGSRPRTAPPRTI